MIFFDTVFCVSSEDRYFLDQAEGFGSLEPPSTVAGGEDGTVDGGRWEGRYRRRWPVGRTVPSTVASGKDGTVDDGQWEVRYRRRWPVGRTVASTVASGKDGGKAGTVDGGRWEGRYSRR